jgi:hypothetical protein
MEYEGPIRFGDRVLVRDTATAWERGLVGIAGVVFGETTPSVTGVEVIGTPRGDFALNVELDDGAGNFWFAADMVEFLDHAPGTEIQVGDVRLVRQPDGQWSDASPPKPAAPRKVPRAARKDRQESRPWWRFW